MTSGSPACLGELRNLLETALVLADEWNEPMIGIRIAEALDMIAARNDPQLADP